MIPRINTAIYTHHLASSGHSSCYEFPPKLDPTGFRIHSSSTHEVIDGQLYGFFGCDTLRRQGCSSRKKKVI